MRRSVPARAIITIISLLMLSTFTVGEAREWDYRPEQSIGVNLDPFPLFQDIRKWYPEWQQSGAEEYLRQVVRRAASAGFTRIYYRCTCGGTLTYPSSVGTVYPGPRGTFDDPLALTIQECDPLTVLVDEAHRQGVELWGWVCLFDHHILELQLRDTFFDDHPEYWWQRENGNCIFGYPSYAQPEVEHHMLSIVREILAHNVDGIHFSLRSHAHSGCGNRDSDFCEEMISEFVRRYGKDPRDYEWGTEERDDFVRLRAEYLTEFIRQVREISGPAKLAIMAHHFAIRLTDWMNYVDIETIVNEGLADEVCGYEVIAPWVHQTTGTTVPVFGWNGVGRYHSYDTRLTVDEYAAGLRCTIDRWLQPGQAWLDGVTLHELYYFEWFGAELYERWASMLEEGPHLYIFGCVYESDRIRDWGYVKSHKISGVQLRLQPGNIEMTTSDDHAWGWGTPRLPIGRYVIEGVDERYSFDPRCVEVDLTTTLRDVGSINFRALPRATLEEVLLVNDCCAELRFSRAMSQASSANPDNFQITPPLDVLRSGQGSDRTWVRLQTERQVAETQYTVDASRLMDSWDYPVSPDKCTATWGAPSLVSFEEIGVQLLGLSMSPVSTCTSGELLNTDTILQWDPAQERYSNASSSPVQSPCAFWVRLQDPIVIDVDYSQEVEHTWHLAEGWNMVAVPGTRPLPIEALPDFVLPYAWLYENGAYQLVGRSDFPGVASSSLVPWRGYWILSTRTALADLSVQPSQITAREDFDVGWVAAIVASQPGSARGTVYFGEMRAGERLSVASAPAAPTAGLQLSFQAADGRELALDLCTRQARHCWQLLVRHSEGVPQVTLAWPDLSSVPKDTALILEDLTTRKRVLMRTSCSYVYTPGERETSRLFLVAAEPRHTQIRILGLSVQQTGSGTFQMSFVLSNPAPVDIGVRNIAGQLVKKVAEGRPSRGGVNRVVWNRISDRGTRIPPGLYLAEIELCGGDGTKQRLVTPLRIRPRSH